MQAHRRVAWGLFFTVLLTAAGCAQLGTPAGGGGAAGAGELVAEIDRIDAGARQIVGRTPDGRLETVSFDERTRVMYRGQSHPVTALERGDMVSMRLASTGPPAYVDLISVQQSVQERRGTAGPPGTAGSPATPGPAGAAGPTTGPTAGSLPIHRIEGTVGMIDAQRGLFEVRTRDLGTLMVSLPYNPRGPDIERFQRLRSGDTVRVAGRLLTAQRFELEQFQ